MSQKIRVHLIVRSLVVSYLFIYVRPSTRSSVRPLIVLSPFLSDLSILGVSFVLLSSSLILIHLLIDSLILGVAFVLLSSLSDAGISGAQRNAGIIVIVLAVLQVKNITKQNKTKQYKTKL